jgi:hypothetical protein
VQVGRTAHDDLLEQVVDRKRRRDGLLHGLLNGFHQVLPPQLSAAIRNA